MAKSYKLSTIEEDEQSLILEKQAWEPMRLNDESTSTKSSRLLRHWPWIGHGVLLSVSLTLLVLSYCERYSIHSDVFFTKKFSSYSPAANTVRYHSERWELLPIMEGSPYVGYGNAVDRAWDHITNNIGDQMINKEELDRLGLDPKSLKIEDPKTGEVGYRAGIEVFHQLHCLNLLRMATWQDYYSNPEVGGDVATDAEDLRGHVDHCLEALRMALMCQSDIGVFTFKFYDGLDGHWPDFSTLHTCRNFDDIRQWAMDKSVTFEDEE